MIKRNKNHNQKFVRILRRGIPLAFHDNNLLLYRYGNVIEYDLSLKKKSIICSIPNSRLRKILGKSRILSRRFGLEEIKAAKVCDDKLFLNYHRCFYIIDLANRSLKQIEDVSGSNGLVLCMSKTSRGILWGDYGYNPEKKSMGIYCYNNDSIELVYRFQEGVVNHIHNIIEDSVSHRIWIFVGDFNNSAAIYYTDDFFESLICIGYGDQKYRGCQGFSYNNDLYYATDSPLTINHLMHWNNGVFEVIQELNGSCIYGVNTEHKMIFSTSVENQTDELDNSINMYKYNLGNGIKDWYSELMVFDYRTKSCITVLRVKKDFWPMLAYKYGTYRFPSELFDENKIVFYGQSLKKVDGDCFCIE